MIPFTEPVLQFLRTFLKYIASRVSKNPKIENLLPVSLTTFEVINGAYAIDCTRRLLCNKHGKVFEKDEEEVEEGRRYPFYPRRVSQPFESFPSHWKFDAVIGKM